MTVTEVGIPKAYPQVAWGPPGAGVMVWQVTSLVEGDASGGQQQMNFAIGAPGTFPHVWIAYFGVKSDDLSNLDGDVAQIGVLANQEWTRSADQSAKSIPLLFARLNNQAALGVVSVREENKPIVPVYVGKQLVEGALIQCAIGTNTDTKDCRFAVVVITSPLWLPLNPYNTPVF